MNGGTDFVEQDRAQPNSHESLLARLLHHCVIRDATDLHVSGQVRPMLRIDGVLEEIADHPPMDESQMQAIAAELLGGQPPDWSKGSIDGACFGPDATRFRFNLYRRQGLLAVALRRLEERFRSLSELGMPESLYALSDLRDGLVILTGPTGAGKSTTLATLLDRINQTRACHIITIEDPIEYIHKPAKGLIHQRQVGLDAPSFNKALVAALRQDPDVILVGEIRDRATIRTAIIAAQTGHLVFATLHAGDCAQAVERLVSVFSKGEHDAVRRQLSLVLRAVIAQHLLPTTDAWRAGNRAAVSEVLMVTPAVANLITLGKGPQLYSAMESGQSLGMQTLEQDLARLWVSGAISEQTAAACARNASAMRERAELLRRRGEAGRQTVLGRKP